MISYCSFDLHFSNNYQSCASFYMLIGHLYVFLKKCLFRSSAHFLTELLAFLIFSCMSCLHILEINPFPVATFAFFFHSVGFPLVLLMVSFGVQKLLSLTGSCLFLFPLL